MAEKNKNYVNNKEFLELLISYKKNGCRKDYEKLGKIFLLIEDGLSHKVNFNNYHVGLKDEMSSLALERMVKNIKNFNEEKYDNPHAYFTTIAWRAHQHVLNVFHKEEKTFVRIPFMDSLNETDDYNEDYEDTYKLDNIFVVDEMKRMNSYIVDDTSEDSFISEHMDEMQRYNVGNKDLDSLI